ncbi:23S rRNA (cytidine1920-2'-O)/16S rRNA (cytidine1409-2'-O)-methyltransferase [Raineyella antarctica]|uniref:23S rRNA (Cytidine1920-2'-O)/16S rRNA (Cytidine1409-2'-O)-methyltransferase n=1 Tax=Raineyella antarctica TaxID=1577474 RepID=A0A1G6GS03_9ACTN|nr:TlyA family RNA methyltransferase [Raineyella antarctica]SDB84770.1 23S rRNA (cytidine1920-2'-O)/16S rRNA (cytidine1409-2'-O)-methyltransferase [Raineyella antarctica]
MRLDRVLAELALARSRSHAQELIKAGRVRVAGRVVTRPATDVDPCGEFDVDGEEWVGRAAHKLLGALEDLPVPVAGRGLDVGSSTGGFTQVLLAHGIQEVYCVDVGHDQLDESLRADPRVHVREGLNAKELNRGDLDGLPVDLVVADVSFISLTHLLPAITAVAGPHAYALLMVKPQFEVGRQGLDKKGVVRDEPARLAAVEHVAAAARDLGWEVTGSAASRLPGPAGNIEYFLRLARNGR